MSLFPPYSNSNNKTELKLDLFTYSTKYHLKNAAGVC